MTNNNASPVRTAKTSAERQSDYRQRRRENAEKRLDLYLSSEALDMLNMLVTDNQKSKREILEKLIRKKFIKSGMSLPTTLKNKK